MHLDAARFDDVRPDPLAPNSRSHRRDAGSDSMPSPRILGAFAPGRSAIGTARAVCGVVVWSEAPLHNHNPLLAHISQPVDITSHENHSDRGL